MVLGYLGRCRFRHELIKIKGEFCVVLIQSIGRMHIVRTKLDFYVQERRKWDAQRPISRGFRRYRGIKQGKLRKMLVESGYCAMDPSQKASCYFEYTGQFLCERSLVKAIELLEERGENWKFDPPGSKMRNLLGQIHDLTFFVSREEKGNYDKERVGYVKDEIAAKAAIKLEEDALDTLIKQQEKCTNELQKKALQGIISRRKVNLKVHTDELLVARAEIRRVMPFLKFQVWKEEVDPRKGKGSYYINRFSGEARHTEPPSYWRAVSCAKCIQNYYRAYNGRQIAVHGACEVYPVLAPKFVCFFDRGGSMKMSKIAVRDYLNDGKGMMKRHIIKAFEQVAIEEKSARIIHRVCKRYRIKVKIQRISKEVEEVHNRNVLIMQRWWRCVSMKVVFVGAVKAQLWLEGALKTERRYILALDCCVPDAIKLQEKLQEARQHEIEAAASKKRMMDLYATQYIDDYSDIVEVTQVAAAKKKELEHIDKIHAQTKAGKEEAEAVLEAGKAKEAEDTAEAASSTNTAQPQEPLVIPPLPPQEDTSPRRKKRPVIYTPSNSSGSEGEEEDDGASDSESSSSYWESPRTKHDRVFKEMNDAKDCSGILKWVLPFLVPCESNIRALAPEMGQRQLLQIAEVRSAILMQRCWRTRVQFKKARDEILRRVQERRRLEAERIALENYSVTRIASCYRCLVARRLLHIYETCRMLAERLSENICDVPKIVAKHDRLWNEHKGFLGQVSLDAGDLLRAISWSRRPTRHPLVNQELKMKTFPESQKLVQGTVTLAARTARAPINVPPPPPDAGVRVLHRGPGGIVPIPLMNDKTNLYKGIDDDAHFSDWEGRALPPLTLKLQLISAYIKRDAKPITSTTTKKLKGVANIVGRMGRDVNDMRKKRMDAEEEVKVTNKVKEHETTKTVQNLYEEVSEQLLNRVEKGFIACDDNGDGVLSRKEVIMAALSNPEVRELLQLPPVFTSEFDEVFDRLDADKNDAVSFEEFQHFFLPSSKSGVDAKYARIKAGFDLMDKNGDGSLTRTEILTALMGEQSIRALLNVADPETDEFEDMYRKMDTDNSGEISWVEFRGFFFPEWNDEVKQSSDKLYLIQKLKGGGAKKKKFDARATFKRAVKKTTAIRLLSSISNKETEIEVGGASPQELVTALRLSSSGGAATELVDQKLHPFLKRDPRAGGKAVQLTVLEKTRATKLRKAAKKIKGAKFMLNKDGSLQVVGKGGAVDKPSVNGLLGKEYSGTAEVSFLEGPLDDVVDEELLEEDEEEEFGEGGLGLLLEMCTASDLGMADSGFFSKGASDPYVVVMVGEKTVHKTGVVYDDVNPTWDPVEHQSKTILNIRSADYGAVTLHAFDYDALGDDEFLGMLKLDPKQLENPTEERETFPLVRNPSLSKKKNSLVQGTLTIRLSPATEEEVLALKSTEERSMTGKPRTPGGFASSLYNRAKSSVPMFRSQTASIEPDDLPPPCLDVTKDIRAHVNWCSGGQGSGPTPQAMYSQPNPNWGNTALFYLPIPERKAAFQKHTPLEIQLKRGRDLYGSVTMTHADILSAIGCTTEWDIFDNVEGGYAFDVDMPVEEKKNHVSGSVSLLLSFEPPARTEAREIVKEVTNDIIADVLALIPQLVPRVELQINAIQNIHTKRPNGDEWKPTVLVLWNHSECGRAKTIKLNPVDLVAEVKRAFDLIDVNGDGQLDRIEVVNGVLQNEEVRTLLKLPAVIDDAFDKWFAELDKENSKFISFDVFADHFLPASAKAQMIEEQEMREQHALEATNNLTTSDESDGSSASDFSIDEDEGQTSCSHDHSKRPSIKDVQQNPGKFQKHTHQHVDYEDDHSEEENNEGPAEYEISPSGLIAKKKKSVFDAKSDVPFWGEEFFPLPVPEYWPPGPQLGKYDSPKRNFVRNSGSNDKGGKLGMPMGLLEDDTANVHLCIEIHDLEGKAEEDAGVATKLASTIIPIRQMFRPIQTKLDFPLDISGPKGSSLLDEDAFIQIEMCARRVKVPKWKTRLGVVGQHVVGDITTAVNRIPQPRAELKIIDAVDIPEHVKDLKCVILWGDRSRKTGQVGREVRQVPMSNRLSKKGKIVWDPRSRNKKLFLPVDDLRRQDLEIHVHGVFHDEEGKVDNQPVCLGYIQLNGDTPFLQPRQSNDREGNPSTEVLYFPLVHSVEHATSGVLRVMQGQLGIQIRSCEVPNEVNRQLKPPQPTLKVTIHDATNVARAVPFGFSNPYVKIFWCGELVAKTLVEHKTLNPVWREEQFIMPLPFDKEYLKMTGKLQKVYMLDLELRVEVWSQGKVRSPDDEDGVNDKFLGQVTLVGKDLKRMPMYYYPFDLKPRTTSSDPREAMFVQGTIGVGLELEEMEVEMPVVYDDVDEGAEANRGKSRMSGFGGESITELLSGAKLLMHVVEAWGLAKADTFGKSDPMCIIKWGGEEVGRTKAIDNTMEPVWDDEKFTLVYGKVGSTPILDVECYDMDMMGPGDFLGMVSLEGKELLNPPQKPELKNEMDLPAKTEWKGGVFGLQPMPGKGGKFNRMVQGTIVLGFDQSDAMSMKKAHHDAVKMKRLAEAQKEAMLAALKHSVRMAKKHMKKTLEKVMASPKGRNDRDLWSLYCAYRKEYTRAKEHLQDHKHIDASHFESAKAVDPEDEARIEKEFAKKRAAEKLKNTKKRKKELSLSEKLALVGAESGATSVGPGGEVHHHGKRKKKKGEEGMETDFEESLRKQAAWEREREKEEREEMFTEDPMCLSWRPNETRERFLMEQEGLDEDGVPKDSPEWVDPQPEDFDPPVLSEWNNDWKVEQRMVPMLPVNRKTLYLRVIDCRGLEEKGFPFCRVWWNKKEVGRTDARLLAEHGRAVGKDKVFMTDPIFQYEEPFLLPFEPGKEGDSHLSVEVWTGPSCRGQVTLESQDLLNQAFRKDEIRDKMRVPFQLFPLSRTIVQKAEDAVRKVINRPRMAQGKLGLMLTIMEPGSVYPPKWPKKASRTKEFEGIPSWWLRFPIVHEGGKKLLEGEGEAIASDGGSNVEEVLELLEEGEEKKETEVSPLKDVKGEKGDKEGEDEMKGEDKKKEDTQSPFGRQVDENEELNRGPVYTKEEVNWEKLASIKYPDYVYKFQILSARGLKKADFMGKSDPFCMISQGGDPVGQTEVVDESMDPVFRRATFDIPFRFISGKRKCPVVIDLYDKDLLSPDPDSAYPPKDADFMGQIVISPEELIELVGEAHHFELKPPDGERGGRLVGGEICCASSVVKAPPPVPRYELQVLRAQGLSKADRFGKSDPFVIITWDGKETGRTIEVERTYNPDWFDDEFFSIPLRVPRQNPDKYHPELKIEVYDMDRGKGGRRELGEFLGGFTLKGAGELQPMEEGEECTHSLLRKEHFVNNPDVWFDVRTSSWLKRPTDGKEYNGSGWKALEVEFLEGDDDVEGEGGLGLDVDNVGVEFNTPTKPEAEGKDDGMEDKGEQGDDQMGVEEKAGEEKAGAKDEQSKEESKGVSPETVPAAAPATTPMAEAKAETASTPATPAAEPKEGLKEGPEDEQKEQAAPAEEKSKGFFGKMADTLKDVRNLEDTWNKADSRYSTVSGTLTYRLILLDATERVEEWVDKGKPEITSDESAIVCRIMDAMELAKADAIGASDPYCRVLWNYREIFRTKAIPDDLNPVWEDTGCFLPVGKYRHGEYDHLKIEVFDKEAMAIGWDMGDFLGEIIFEGDFLKGKFHKYKQDYILQKRKDKDPEEQKLVQGTLALHFSRKRHKTLIKNGLWWPDDDNADGRKPREWLHVKVRKALDLAKADSALFGMGGSSDPYVVIFFNREKVWESKVINNNQNPQWDDGDQFPVPMRGFTYGPPELRIAVYDKDTVGQDEFLGQIFLYGDEVLKMDKKFTMQKTLVGRMGVAKEEVEIKGEIFLSTHVTLEPSFLSIVDKFELSLPYDVVAVQVVDARNLPKSDRLGLSDPYVVVLWRGEEVARTKTIQETLSPKWEKEWFLFAIPKDRDLMELRFEVYDDDLGIAGQMMGGLVEAAGGKSKGDFLGRVTLKRDDLFDPPLFKKDLLLDGGPDRKKQSRQRALDEAKEKMMDFEGAGATSHFVIVVSVHRARGLAKADMFGKSDPVVVGKWNGVEVGRSPILKKTLDPDWGQFDFPPIKVDEEEEDGEFTLEVYDADFGKIGDFLGCSSFKVAQLKAGGGEEVELG